jgi:hypothetical protein
MGEELSQEKYLKLFNDHKMAALLHSLEIRRFEIDLYWKRATYFWAFIAATLAGYGVVQASSMKFKTDLSVIISCLGFVFSCGWYWESHVDLLEDAIIGPLFKIILKQPRPGSLKGYLKDFFSGPYPFSVTKINQIISVFVSFLWLFLLGKSLPKFSLCAEIKWDYVLIISVTFLIVVSFFIFKKNDFGEYKNIAIKRRVSIRRPKT